MSDSMTEYERQEFYKSIGFIPRDKESTLADSDLPNIFKEIFEPSK
jgi:hypothetical protein